jgi:CHAT domain-containing protein
VDDVMSCITGSPRVDVLHFAVHGNYDTQGNQDGLVLTDRRVLDPTVVRGLPMAGRPFVFLNACQVGTGQEILGDYGGMAMAFIRAGACGVVAPLWSINDKVAADLALAFYDKVREGESPAAVLREARGAHGAEPKTTSGTHFAYQFFGHPGMKLAVRGGGAQ